MIWCLLVLAALVGLEILGLRWFYATVGARDACHCDQPWRGEFIANFGHEPEVSRLTPSVAPIPTRPFRTPLLRWGPGVRSHAGGLRSATPR